MIRIREDYCKNVPGITSLFLFFNYNKQIQNLVKNCDTYYFHKKTLEWEVPLNWLAYILDNLVYYDDIELIILEKESKKENIMPTLTYKLTPFDYQLDGIIYGLNNNKFLLLDAPGLGKTSQIIHIAEELKATRGLEHCLIICGVATLKSNWKKEIKKHSNLSCVILGERTTKTGSKVIESVAKRADQLLNNIDEFFIITNIETLRDDRIINAIKKGPNKIDMLAIDEVHKCKSPSAQQTKNLLKLSYMKYIIGATGTLLLNNPLDAYVPLKLIGTEKSNFTQYKEYYCEFFSPGSGLIVGLKNINILKNHINQVSLRRTKELLKLPKKTIIDEYIDMNDKQFKFYNNIKKGIKEEVNKVKLTTKSILAMTTRLRQATACPSILTTENIVSSKIERAVDIAEQLISNNEKVIIFSTFKETVKELEILLAEYNPLVLTGDTKEGNIADINNKFQTDDSYKVFLGTWQKAGTGIDLYAASFMIFIDTPWTWAEYEQSQDRLYRIGTHKPVFIYNLICNESVDEKVYSIVRTKKAFSEYIIDDKIYEESVHILQKYLLEEL